MNHELVTVCRNIGELYNDPMKLQQLGRRVTKAIAANQLGGEKLRVAVLSTFLTDMLVESLPAFFLARGIIAEIVKAPYGAIAVDVLSNTSCTHDCQIVVLLPSHRDLICCPDVGASVEEANAAVEREVSIWVNIWKHISAPIVQLSFDPPPWRFLAEADGFYPGGLLRHVRRVNQGLGDRAPANVALVDAEALASRVGECWHDPRIYYLCKQPFAPSALPDIACSIVASAAGVLGKARKVLVMDLDNTLWGGVIGDLGSQGIVLGNETPEGEAFVALQFYAKKLARRGVILAVCSKNDSDLAREPFRHNSAMVLREDDIACFVANFEDKATNIRIIASTLSVGLDAVVFVDDSPIEREWVKRELPEVLVIDLPEEPALFCDAIERAQAFPMSALTREDVGRNASYRSRTSVSIAKSKASDLDAFLEGLESVAVVENVSAASLDRVLGLIGKTNQFKLNPRTFTAEAILARSSDALMVRFRDRMQDYGITSVLVTEIEKRDLVILNWVMSCRVFSRRLEHAILEVLRTRAIAAGASRIRACFEASARNGVARDALRALGFVVDGKEDYVLPVIVETSVPSHFIRVDQ